MATPPSIKILLTGKNGQIGAELQHALAPLGEVVACGSAECDFSKASQLRELVQRVRPNLIVNAAAYTAVDKAEEEAGLAKTVNADAPAILAEEAKKLHAGLVHFSTDYVFDGSKDGPYTEEDVPQSGNVYGATKAEGDSAVLASGVPHFVFRTTWVYGLRGKNFLLTMQRLARERDELKIVDDQFGAPTWSRSIAQTTANILTQMLDADSGLAAMENASGLYNLSCSGRTSWFGFAQAIIASLELPNPPRLIAIPTSEFPTPAVRPKNSVLSHEKIRNAFGIILPDWADTLKSCLNSAVKD